MKISLQNSRYDLLLLCPAKKWHLKFEIRVILDFLCSRELLFRQIVIGNTPEGLNFYVVFY